MITALADRHTACHSYSVLQLTIYYTMHGMRGGADSPGGSKTPVELWTMDKGGVWAKRVERRCVEGVATSIWGCEALQVVAQVPADYCTL